MGTINAVQIRPYQILRIICRLGSSNKRNEEYYYAKELDVIVKQLQEDPYVPL